MLWSRCWWPVSLGPAPPEVPTTLPTFSLAQHRGEAIVKSWLPLLSVSLRTDSLTFKALVS